MDLSEPQVESFIVKLWTEADTGPGEVTWHGYITHVSDGARRYLKDLDEIKIFIEPYLVEKGVDVGKRWSVRRWLKRFNPRVAKHE